MRELKLHNGRSALVDDDKYEAYNAFVNKYLEVHDV